MPLIKPSESRLIEIAAIDLGSNSFHMIVARIVNGTLQIYNNPYFKTRSFS